MNKKVLAGVLSLMLVLPITGEARRHTYVGLTGATNGFDPRAHSYSIRRSHRPSWLDHAMEAWEYFVGGAFPGHDPSIIIEIMKRNGTEKKKLAEQVIWQQFQEKILNKLKEENERKENGTEVVTEIQESNERMEKAEASNKYPITPIPKRIEEKETGPQLIEKEMGNGGFQKWKDNNRKKLEDKYTAANKLIEEVYLPEIRRIEEKIVELKPKDTDSEMITKNKKMQIRLYQAQIEKIRRKIVAVTENMEMEDKTHEKMVEDAEHKETTRQGAKFAIFDPYNPTAKEIENGATRPDENKKLPTPF